MHNYACRIEAPFPPPFGGVGGGSIIHYALVGGLFFLFFSCTIQIFFVPL